MTIRPSQPASATARPRRSRLARAGAAPYLMLAPFVALFLVFALAPIVQSVSLVFHTTEGPAQTRFVGLDNLIALTGDTEFRTAVGNTLTFTVLSLAVQIPLGLGLALLLNSPGVRGTAAFRFVLFAPNLVGNVFAALLFTGVFNPRFGLVNRLVERADGLLPVVGLPTDLRWLQDPALVMPSTIIAAAWLGVGFNMVFFLAALSGVNRQLFDAARVDGAGRLRRFAHVTLPAIGPMLVFLIVVNTIFSLRVFELPWLLNGGTQGPQDSGLFVITYLYQRGFIEGDLGYASAIGWVLTLAVVLLAAVQVRARAEWRQRA